MKQEREREKESDIGGRKKNGENTHVYFTTPTIVFHKGALN